jgi:hypothetical protein
MKTVIGSTLVCLMSSRYQEEKMDAVEHVSKRATQIGMACKDALQWYSTSVDERIQADKGLLRELRTSVVTADRLALAVQSKMAVGVFGPSQAGKSYLISALARSADDSLLTRMGDRDVDFIAKINPEGGKESTGLVTRFSYCDEKLGHPAGLPIRVRLLTELDIVKILANSFVEDVLHQAEDDASNHQAGVEAAIERARSAVPGTGTLSVEDMYDLEGYCQQSLLKNPRIAALKKFGFWTVAVELMPTMPPENRVEFFSVLWEGVKSYTDIYRRLQSHLIRLNHAKIIHCEPSALFDVRGDDWNRQKKSIIDVATLDGLCSDSGDTVRVAPNQSMAVDMERAELAALVSELHIQLAEQPHPFFKSTDLLDFPGARSRQPLPRELLAGTTARSEAFLRGKVAYLFERYSAERELSAMLLCVGPSNQEVVGLGELIERWVELTHGATPEERSRVPCSLFFVLTKFDTAFEQGAGKSIDGTRWTTRLEASLLKPFGDHSHRTKWVSDWSGNGEFKNLFWLRNPNLRQDALFDFASPDSFKEICIRSDKVAFLDQLRKAFVENPLVGRHFDDAHRAWDSALVLNDGGISRIVSGLEQVCRPEVKLGQIDAQVNSLADRVLNLLARHYVTSDVGECRAQKVQLAQNLVKVLAGAMKKEKLGAFLASLKLDDESARDAYFQTEREIALRSNESAASGEGVEELDDEFSQMFGLTLSEPSVPQSDLHSKRDFASVFANNMIEAWLSSIVEQSKNASSISHYGIPGALVVDLARELETATQKTGLYQAMVADVRKSREYRNLGKSVWMWKQVAPVTGRFNDFIDHAGHVDIGSGGISVQTLDARQVRIFSSDAATNPMNRLSETSLNFERTYLSDWVNGIQATVRTNADFLAGMPGDTAANSRLGEILDQLRAVENSRAIH